MYSSWERDEISQKNYVRDPRQAELYVLLTQQQTGGGEENDIESNFSGGITADRITDAWKINIRFLPEYTERRTDTEEEIF